MAVPVIAQHHNYVHMDPAVESLKRILQQVVVWGKQCLTKPSQLGGVSARTFWILLFMYARRAGIALLRQRPGRRLLSETTVKRVAAAAFGAVRYVIHAGTTWTSDLERATGCTLEQLTPTIRWMLKSFTPLQLQSWNRNELAHVDYQQ